MVEYNTSKALEEIPQTNTLTGNKNKSCQLYYQLKKSFSKSHHIDIIVSFLMTSGVSLLIKDIKDAIKRGCKIRILTGTYLGITQPEAIALLKKECKENLELRFFLGEASQSFHPKAYIFHYENSSDIFVGSSNISRSALTSGIEWNYRLSSNQNKNDFDYFYNTFLDLYNNHSLLVTNKELKAYASSYKKSVVIKEIEKLSPPKDEEDESEDNENNNSNIIKMFTPRGAQIEALYALETSREEGATKGLIFAATGVGKTYLAAFDSKNYKRVLFVAHQEELLKQAAQSFHNVRPKDDYGFFYGKERNIKDSNDNLKPLVFASVQSLGKEENLNPSLFPRDYFDYIVIDEFHHAVNTQYRNIINYFKPKFLLGLTATPERTDGRNIYELCDYNVPFEINLFQSINRGLLVPFHYYGIYDEEVDYSKASMYKGRYKESDLNKLYINNTLRDSLIIKNYLKYNSKRALGFCCSRSHAQYMANVFSTNGIPSVAVFSGSSEEEHNEYFRERDKAIKDLKEGKIKVIFSVNMFNEGVDIPSVDTVLFLRATDSDVVFLQQLGRGLRLSKGKEYLNVLDFIGNYKKAGQFIRLLQNKNNQEKEEEIAYIDGHNPNQKDFPDGCFVDFDLKLIDLLEKLNRKRNFNKLTIKEDFYKVMEMVGHVPSRVELFTNMDDEIYNYCILHSSDNIYKNYWSFLNDENLLNDEQKEIYNSISYDFLHEVEITSMTKIYKMPVLKAFYDEDKEILKEKLSEEELLSAWKKFFNENCNWKDLSKDISFEEYKNISDKTHLANIKKNPVTFLIRSGKGLFEGSSEYPIKLREDLIPYLSNKALIKDFLDIIDYRTYDYYSRRYNSNN